MTQANKTQANAIDNDVVMTPLECADFVKVHRSSINKSIQSGDLKAFVICPGSRKKYRVMKSDLLAWVTRLSATA